MYDNGIAGGDDDDDDDDDSDSDYLFLLSFTTCHLVDGCGPFPSDPWP